jgi:hypothetical protein
MVAVMSDITNSWASGELSGKLTADGVTFMRSLLKRKMVMALDDEAMDQFRTCKPHEILDMEVVFGGETYVSRWEVIRRDWKRNKIHFLEVIDV